MVSIAPATSLDRDCVIKPPTLRGVLRKHVSVKIGDPLFALLRDPQVFERILALQLLLFLFIPLNGLSLATIGRCKRA
jgi:hypothetical protein